MTQKGINPSQSQLKESLITQQVDDEIPQPRPFYKRAFSKMEKGSLRGVMFTLMGSALGTGLFNLTVRVEQVGLIPFILYVVVAGLFSYVGMYMITVVKIKIEADSYGQMAGKTYGTYIKRLSQFILIVYPWGITICFQVIFAKFILQLLDDVAGLQVYQNRDKDIVTNLGFWVRIAVNVGGIALNMIFILRKQAGFLQKVGLIGVAAVTFNFVTIFIISMVGFIKKISDGTLEYHGIFRMSQYPQDVHIKWFADKGWSDVSKHFQVLASIVFCYVCHQMIFPLSKSLSRPTKQRLFKIFLRANVVEVIAYLIFGVVSYLLLLERVNEYEIKSMVIQNITITVVSIGKGLIVISLFFSVPLNIFPVRQTLYQAFDIQRTNRNHLVISISLALSSCAVAISFQKVNSYFGLLGGTAGVIMAGGLPSLFYLKAATKLNFKDYLMLGLCLLITIAGFVGAITSVIDPA